MIARLHVAVVAALLLAACSGGGGSNSAAQSPQPEPSVAASAEPIASSEPSAAASEPSSEATEAPTPTPTPNDNLLSPANGTFLRTYPSGMDPDCARNVVETQPGVPDDAPAPIVFVFELPGQATFASFAAGLPEAGSGNPAKIAIAVSRESATSGFSDVGTMTGGTDAGIKTLSTTATGRWVRVTATRPVFTSLSASGTVAPLPSGVRSGGVYGYHYASPFKDGSFNAGDQPGFLTKVVTQGDDATLVECNDGAFRDTYAGTWHGRTFTTLPEIPNGSETRGFRGAINDEGTTIVGMQANNAVQFWVRTSAAWPDWCLPKHNGSGSHRVLRLEGDNLTLFLTGENSALPGFSFTHVQAGLFEPSMLAGMDTVILDRVCNGAEMLNPSQIATLVKWLPGHKLIMYNSDACSGTSDYTWLPYPFTTHNPGAKAARGNSLFLLENDALGTTDKDDATHFVDARAYASGDNQLGDADSVITKDPHWCGHVFLTSDTQDEGITQMYAITANNGVMIFDGLDNNDDNQIPQWQKLHTLEMQLPVPASGLPCTVGVGGFAVAPSQESSFAAGKASTLPFTLQALAANHWTGQVTLKTSGDFASSVTPDSVDLTGDTKPIALNVTVPANAKPGAYTVTVTGTDASGNSSTASITLTATPPPIIFKKPAIKKQQRIVVYGIHFDYDSAHIQPKSEAVVAQIAGMLKANPSWHFQVEGHTDSDGGAAYNLALSQRRAQSVVDDLVTHYGIARMRLVPKGFGLGRPVASNATAAGKALNRRVELLRLQ